MAQHYFNRRSQTDVDESDSGVAKQIGQAASYFERQRTGRKPQSVTVVFAQDTLLIRLYGVLSPGELASARNPADATRLKEFHRQLFMNSCGPFLAEIKRITGVEVGEASAEVELSSGAVSQLSPSSALVLTFLLGRSVPAGTWSGDASEGSWA